MPSAPARAGLSIARRSAGLFGLIGQLALAACGAGTAVKADDPILVIGVAAVAGKLDGRLADDIWLHWWQYDPLTARPLPRSPTRDFTVSTQYAGRTLYGSPETRGTFYTVRRIEPGDYVLAEISFAKGPGIGGRTVNLTTTALTSLRPTFGIFDTQSQNSDRTARLTASTTYRFSAKPNEVIYLGDFEIAGQDFPSRVARIQRNDEAARAVFQLPENKLVFADSEGAARRMVFRDATDW
ncbi:MAG: hypothetical protein FJX35_21865 [Alphaproteobacteria bacterium]|nr:hypothetical protein [Alphaproteobacteria bacterium]